MHIEQAEVVILNDVRVDFRNQQITKNQSCIDVDGQCLEVLQCLLRHNQHTVTRDQLLDEAWHGITVGDNALSQTIATLRKIFDDDPKQPRFIRTVARKGYQLIATVRFLEAGHETQAGHETYAGAQDPEVEATLSEKSRSWFSFALVALVALLLTATAIAFLFNQQRQKDFDADTVASEVLDKPGSQPKNFIPVATLTTNPGLESFARISPSGQWLVYSEEKDGGNLDLRLLDLRSNRSVVLLNSPAEEYRAEWSPDEKWLAYVHEKDNQCEIRIVALPSEHLLISENIPADPLVLMPCEPSSHPPMMRWIREDQIYVSLQENGRRTLRRLSLSREKEAPHFSIAEAATFAQFHPYLIDVSDDKKFMIIAEKIKRHYEISRIDLATMEPTLLHKRNNRYRGLSWFDTKNRFLYGPTLTVGDMVRDQQTLYYTSKSIVDIDYHQGTEQLVVSEASADLDLHTFELGRNGDSEETPANTQPIVPSTQIDYMPAISPDGKQLAFMSNRLNQWQIGIWLVPFSGGEAFLVKDLPKNFFPSRFIWSDDGAQLLISSNQKRVYRLNLLSRELTAVSPADERAFGAHWLKGGQHIRYSIKKQDQWQVWTVDLTTGSHKRSGHFKNDIALAQLSDKSDITYDADQHQIVRLNPQTQDRHILLPNTNFNEFVILEDGIYYLKDDAEGSTIYFYDYHRQTHSPVLTIGDNSYFLGIPRWFSVSRDRKQLIFTKIKDVQADLLMFRPEPVP